MTEPVKEIMKEIVDVAEKVGVGEGGESFQDTYLEEIQELTDTTPEDNGEVLPNQCQTMRKKT